MKDKIRLVLFDLIYNELGLKTIEDEFKEKNIPHKEVVGYEGLEPISQYFFLNNDVFMDRLSQEEIAFLNDGINSSDPAKMDSVYTFLKQNKQRLLLPETNEPYLCWGPMSFEYMAPSDAIVLGFHTLEFTDESSEEKTNYIYDRLNYIQDRLAKDANMKVAVIIYNEDLNNIIEK